MLIVEISIRPSVTFLIILYKIFLCQAYNNSEEALLLYDSADGLYQQSVTLTARMWPTNEDKPSTRTAFDLSPLALAISSSVLLLVLLIVLVSAVRSYFHPRKETSLSLPILTNKTAKNIMSKRTIDVCKDQRDSCCIVIPMPIAPPKYSAPPAPAIDAIYDIPKDDESEHRGIPKTHKSMWAVNSKYITNSMVTSESDTALKSRSLPSWGRSKQRPASNAENFEELYVKINANKKARNRMGNEEAAIIALCRSRSQNLQRHPFEREGVVIYDERTSL